MSVGYFIHQRVIPLPSPPNDFNALIDHPSRTEFDDDIFRKFVFDGEPYQVFPQGSDVFDVLKEARVFPSKNEARRQWKRGPLKEGINDFKNVGKLRRRIFVLKLPDDFPAATLE